MTTTRKESENVTPTQMALLAIDTGLNEVEILFDFSGSKKLKLTTTVQYAKE